MQLAELVKILEDHLATLSVAGSEECEGAEERPSQQSQMLGEMQQ